MSLLHPNFIYDLKQDMNIRYAWDVLLHRAREAVSSRKMYLSNCCSCPLVNLCFWCPAICYLESGKLDQKIEYFCRVAKARANIFVFKNNIKKILRPAHNL